MKKNKVITNIFFFIGIMLCLYPIVSRIFSSITQQTLISTHESIVMKNTGEMKQILTNAQKYNSLLNGAKSTINSISPKDMKILNEYNKQLNINGDGIMGTIEIPKINVNLPIYHGTSDRVLSKGVGHFEESSLPVGEENTRTILTGHRGLPNAKLFTRLDEVKKEDLFFIRVCGETLAYKVKKIEVINPEDVEKLSIIPQKDLVSLVTCTPYGVNTHRLVVTGERVPYKEKMENTVKKNLFSFYELCFTILPIILIVIMIWKKYKERKQKQHEKKQKKI